jgi:hypothetical protein
MARCAWVVESDDVLDPGDVVEGLMWQKCHFEMLDDASRTCGPVGGR